MRKTMATMRARRAWSQFWKWTLTRASMIQAAKPRNQIHAVFLVIRVIGMIVLRREVAAGEQALSFELVLH
jgi:hypothetical protein